MLILPAIAPSGTRPDHHRRSRHHARGRHSTWTETEWATAGNFESWTTSGITSGTVSGGVLSGTTSSTAPQLSRTSITGGPDLDLGFNDYLEVRMQLPATYTGNFEIYFGVANADVASQTGFSASRMLSVPNGVIPKDGAITPTASTWARCRGGAAP